VDAVVGVAVIGAPDRLGRSCCYTCLRPGRRDRGLERSCSRRGWFGSGVSAATGFHAVGRNGM